MAATTAQTADRARQYTDQAEQAEQETLSVASAVDYVRASEAARWLGTAVEHGAEPVVQQLSAMLVRHAARLTSRSTSVASNLEDDARAEGWALAFDWLTY